MAQETASDTPEQPLISELDCPECGAVNAVDVRGHMPYHSVCRECEALGPWAGSPSASHYHWCEYLGLKSGGRPSLGMPMERGFWIEARARNGCAVPERLLGQSDPP